VDVARGEMVEKELDAIGGVRNSAQMQNAGQATALAPLAKEDPDEREELWKASVRAYDARRREENRAAWYGWHLDQAERHRRTLEALIASHEERAAELVDG